MKGTDKLESSFKIISKQILIQSKKVMDLKQCLKLLTLSLKTDSLQTKRLLGAARSPILKG